MKKIYKNIVILLLSCTLLNISAMEAPEENKQVEIIPQVFPALLSHAPQVDEINIPKLLHFSGLKKDYPSYLQKLQLLTNLLYMRHESLAFFQKILYYTKEALTSSFPNEIFGFDITAVMPPFNESNEPKPHYHKSVPIIPENEELIKKHIPITTCEGRSIGFQLIPLSNNPQKFNASNENRYKRLFTQLLDNENEEVKIIAKKIYNTFYMTLCADDISRFTDIFLFSLLFIDDTAQPLRVSVQTANNIIKQTDLLLKINEILDKHGIYSAVTEVMPQVLSLFAQLKAMKHGYGFLNNNHDCLLTAENVYYNDHIASLIKTISATHQQHAALYKKIMDEKNRILKTLPSQERLEAIKKYKTKILKRNELFERLPDELITQSKTKPIDEWIDKKYHQKPTPTRCTSKKKKKQKHPHSKKATTTRDEEPEEIISMEATVEAPIPEPIQEKEVEQLILPTYHVRILRWFDEDFISANKPSNSSIEYHTINPLIDHFLLSIGQQQEITKDNGQKEMRYLLIGEINYHSNKKKLVCFSCSIDERGICYHRGYNKLDDIEVSEILMGNAYKVQFPSMQEQVYETKEFESLSDIIITNRKYTENQFCIRLTDPKNKIKEIVLYKPLEDI